MTRNPGHLSLLLIAVLTVTCLADEPVVRSLADARQRPFNELAEPRFRVRQTSRGWEIRNRQTTVIARDRQTAEDAARIVHRAWQRTAAIASLWSRSHQQPQFGLGAVQVVIDHAPVRGIRTRPTIQAVAQEAILIYLNTSGADASLGSQKPRLGLATSRAFFIASGLSQRLPAWVQNGLGALVVRQELGDTTPLLPLVQSQVNRRPAPSPSQPVSLAESADRVQFLLTGNDARHAFATLELLARSSRQTPASRPSAEGKFDEAWLRLLRDRGEDFQEWRKDHDVSIPKRAQPSKDKSLAARETEMTFLLKLAQRFGRPQQRTVQPKIFERTDNGFRVAATRRTTVSEHTVRDLARRISRNSRPWATIGPDGQLLFSNNAELRNILDTYQKRYQLAAKEGQLEIHAHLADGRVLVGWLEPNTKQPLRPLVKFELREPKKTSRPKS